MKAKLKTLAVFVCTAVCALTLPACSSGKSIQLGKPAKVTYLSYDEKTDTGFADFKEKVDNFASVLAQSVYQTSEAGENLAVSPVSVYMALSLAAECADGATRNEITDALGVTYEQLRSYIPVLYRSLNIESKSGSRVTGRLNIGNSIWVNEGTQVRQDCLDALSDYYFSYSYSADFGKDNANANKAVRHFVKEQTKGLIDNDFELPTETLFALINTLYLKTIWNADGDYLPFADKAYSFQQSDGAVKDIKLLQGYYRQGRVFEREKYSAFYTSTNDGYRIKFIVPDEGVGIDEVFTAETLFEVNSVNDYDSVDEENKLRYYTRCLFPEYKADYNGDLKDILQSKFGINLLFDEDDCSFSSLTDSKAYCKELKHVTDLTVDKKGIEGAAVTVIPGCGAAGPDEYKEVYEDFIVNKSFGYIITDYQNVTLFSGVVNRV